MGTENEFIIFIYSVHDLDVSWGGSLGSRGTFFLEVELKYDNPTITVASRNSTLLGKDGRVWSKGGTSMVVLM